MYAKNILVVNSGALPDIELQLPFDEITKNPKPLILVGPNGAGKTNLLSIITDALIEIAAKQFRDVAPPLGVGHKFFRVLGGPTLRSGEQFEFAAVRFEHGDTVFNYRSKAGSLEPGSLDERLDNFPGLPPWKNGKDDKITNGDKDKIDQIFRKGCYVYFPSSRSEVPYWANQGFISEAPEFSSIYTGVLNKPIVIESSVNSLRPWVADVIMDQMLDAEQLLNQLTTDKVKANLSFVQAIQNSLALKNLNSILKFLLLNDNVRVVRVGRGAASRKLQIYDGSTPLLPGFDALSSGQSTLLAIFSTVLRYADTGTAACPTSEMEGIVIVDEIDAHLHADLQFVVLPKLMQLFPKIQFIVTAHSPLFLLGMEKAYGNDGIAMVELPNGIAISAERFTESLSEKSLREVERPPSA